MKKAPIIKDVLDVKALVKAAGGRAALAARFKKYGVRADAKNIDAWMGRNSIPCDRLVHLLSVMRRDNWPLNIEDFIIQPTNHTTP